VKRIAIYGKGGIGKSTTVSNMSAALAAQGRRVMQIGCDPKADSTRCLTGGAPIPTVLERLRQGDSLSLDELVTVGEGGVLCVEAGGPAPGTGCAGRGIITAFEKLEALGAYERFEPDVVFYDVLGDVVCGGFAMPIRGGWAEEVCIVSSGEMMSLYAASNIAAAVQALGESGYARLRGIILNAKGIVEEDALVDAAAREIGTEVLFRLPRDPVVQRAEALGRTVVGAFPESGMADSYRSLAETLAGEP
jgi:nitrogenase iron protein NifH